MNPATDFGPRRLRFSWFISPPRPHKQHTCTVGVRTWREPERFTNITVVLNPSYEITP